MASEKVLEKKKSYVSKLAKLLRSSCVGVVVDYSGISATDDAGLRRCLRESNSEYFVVKNTLLSRSAKQSGLDDLVQYLKGSTAIALSKDDYSSAARILVDFSKKNDYFKVKAGFIEGKVVDKKEIDALAKLPNKEVLVANLLRALNSPVSGLANVLSGTIRSLTIVLNAVSEKKAA